MTPAVSNKSSVAELAVFTGMPAFPAPVFVGSPSLIPAEDFIARARTAFAHRWFTNDGPMLREFEGRICERLEVAQCVAVSNGTVAIELALRAAGVTGEVIVPSFTFVATPHAVLWQGLVPVFCDVDPKTHNIDPAHVQRLITERTHAIIGVHLWGRPAYSEQLEGLAEQHNLRLFYDASHAFGCTHDATPIGGRGDAETLSFHATKIVSSFEGGAVLTNNPQLADRVRDLRNFGFVDYDDVRSIGTNAKLSEPAAAMGLASLDHFDRIVACNRRNYDAYRAGLRDLSGLSVLPHDELDESNFQYVVVEIDDCVSPITRDDLVRVLHAENVIARRYFFPGCHRMEPYRTLYPDLTLPVTERLGRQVIILPTGDSIDEATVDAISNLIRLALENASSLPDQLPDFQRGHFGMED